MTDDLNNERPVQPEPEQNEQSVEFSEKPKKSKGLGWFISMFVVILIIGTGFSMLFFVVKQLSKPKAPPAKENAANPKDAKGEDKNKPGQPKQEEDTPKVKVYKVAKENFINSMQTLGTIMAKSKSELRFEVNGLIDVINVKEGDKVRQDDVVAELTHSDAELKVDFRQSKLKEAQIEEKNWSVKVQQNKELLDAGAITQAKYDESVYAFERAKQASKSAKIELKSAEAELEKTYLRSPIDGVMGELKAQKGEFVTSQKEIMFVMEISEVHCEFSVLEKDIQDVKEGMNINLTVDTYPGQKFSGSIIALGAVVTTTEGRARKVKALVTNEDNKLLPGMFSHVEIILLQKEDALTVPNSAFPDIEKDTSTIWIVGEGDKAMKREIYVEHFSSEKALVESGIKVGDLVIVDIAAVKGLKEGAKVEIVEVKEAGGGAGAQGQPGSAPAKTATPPSDGTAPAEGEGGETPPAEPSQEAPKAE